MSSRRPVTPLALSFALTLACSTPAASVIGDDDEGREIAVVVDTSRSMRGQDSRRDTVQMLRVLVDLLSRHDALTVVRMPSYESCGNGPDPGLALPLDLENRGTFERKIDRHLAFDTGTYFATSLRTAISALDGSNARQRLLLVLADAGGLGACDHELSLELAAARRRGVKLAAVHLGRGRGAFDGHPAFESTVAAGDAEELVAAIALVYQRFLGVKQVQNGRVVNRRLEAKVSPHVAQAFLVVAADGEVGPLRLAADHPPFGDIDADYRGGGATRGLDGRRRTYRILRLGRPAPGTWRFEVPEIQDVAGWMLVQESALAVRAVDSEPWVIGEPARLVVEVYDRISGRRVGPLPELQLTVDDVALRDDGYGQEDRQAGDGLYSAELGTFQPGTEYTIHLRSAQLDQQFSIKPETQMGSLKLAMSQNLVADGLDFGTLRAGDAAGALIDLSASQVKGRFHLRLGSDLEARRVALEVDGGRGFEPFEGARLDLTPSHLHFPVRLSVTSCPQAIDAEAEYRLWLESEGGAHRLEIPLRMQIIPEPWLVCWWPALALGIGAVLVTVTFHGLLVPHRFPPRAGLQLAQDESLEEGFFHPFRAQKRSGNGFYRDARLFLHADFRLSSQTTGALARLRAQGSGVALLPLGRIERRTVDGIWEPLDARERRLRPGTTHRAGEVYFEWRHG